MSEKANPFSSAWDTTCNGDEAAHWSSRTKKRSAFTVEVDKNTCAITWQVKDGATSVYGPKSVGGGKSDTFDADNATEVTVNCGAQGDACKGRLTGS
jgi:hypothetical protein